MEKIRCPIAQWAHDNPEASAFIDSVHSYSFSLANQEIERIRIRLEGKRIVHGSRVALLSKNNLSLVFVLFALQRIGAVAVPLNLRLLPEDWKRQMQDAACSLLIAEDALAQVIGNDAGEVESLERLAEGEDTAMPYTPPCEQLSLDDPTTIIFTSGSKGAAKGVVLSLGNHYWSALGTNAVVGLRPGDSWLVSLPLYHAGGLEILYRSAFSGASLVVSDSCSAEEMALLVKKGGITHLSLVPTQLSELLTCDSFSSDSLKVILLAGAPASDILLREISRRNLPVLSAYGMTETTAHITCLRHSDPREKLSSVGRVKPYAELKIVGGDGAQLPSNQIGEVLVKGPMVFSSYLDPDHRAELNEQDWLHTGDLGVLDEDGYLQIIGRKDDMFISGGENIHAGEIEGIAEEYPLVAQSAVIVVEDSHWGKRPVLFVEMKKDEDFEEIAILDFLRARLAKIKVPEQIIHISSMPRTSIAKVDYQKLADMYRSSK